MIPYKESQQLYWAFISLSQLHKRGPYGNLKDVHVCDFIGLLLFKLCASPSLCGEDRSIEIHSQVTNNTLQESRSPSLANNKVVFD